MQKIPLNVNWQVKWDCFRRSPCKVFLLMVSLSSENLFFCAVKCLSIGMGACVFGQNSSRGSAVDCIVPSCSSVSAKGAQWNEGMIYALMFYLLPLEQWDGAVSYPKASKGALLDSKKRELEIKHRGHVSLCENGDIHFWMYTYRK